MDHELQTKILRFVKKTGIEIAPERKETSYLAVFENFLKTSFSAVFSSDIKITAATEI